MVASKRAAAALAAAEDEAVREAISRRSATRLGVRVVLGLVSSKVGALESKSDLARRLEEASRFPPLDQLGLSPQCGFSSTLEGNEVSAEQQSAKLHLCAEVAREVWGGL